MKKLNQDQAVNLTAPMIYTLVTSLDKEGQPNALGVAWVTRTSFDPFLMLVSIDHSRYSHSGIDYHGEFVVNYPSDEQKDGSLICGTKSGRDGDKIKESGLSLVKSEVVKVPPSKVLQLHLNVR